MHLWPRLEVRNPQRNPETEGREEHCVFAANHEIHWDVPLSAAWNSRKRHWNSPSEARNLKRAYSVHYTSVTVGIPLLEKLTRFSFKSQNSRQEIHHSSSRTGTCLGRGLETTGHSFSALPWLGLLGELWLQVVTRTSVCAHVDTCVLVNGGGRMGKWSPLVPWYQKLFMLGFSDIPVMWPVLTTETQLSSPDSTKTRNKS